MALVAACGEDTLETTTEPECCGEACADEPSDALCAGEGCPTSFALSAATLDTLPDRSVSLLIERSGATAGAYRVGFTLSGAACGATPDGAVDFDDGDSAAKTIDVEVRGPGECVVTLQPPTPAGAGLGEPSVARIVAACPAPPADVRAFSFGGAGAHHFINAASGQITTAPLPSEQLGDALGGDINVATSPQTYSRCRTSSS